VSEQHAREPHVMSPTKVATAVAVFLPFVSVVFAIWSVWGWGVTGVDLALLFVMYLITGFGITVGYHRLFTHRSFEATAPAKIGLGIAGSMAVEGPILKWVAVHRRHHQYSDEEHDPHSPHHHGGGIRGVLAGFWHAHVAWIFAPDPPDLARYVGDLYKDPVTHRLSKLFPLWVFLGLAIPAVIGGLIAGTWMGAVRGFLWGGLVRVFMVQHITWSVNSICHLWGEKSFGCPDESRNNVVCGVFALGEGWHNNHHMFPSSARHGLRWWEFDSSYLLIRAMEMVGLVRRVRVPAADVIATERQKQKQGHRSAPAPAPQTSTEPTTPVLPTEPTTAILPPTPEPAITSNP
jgi:stearoyl-CoA desaturase (delta-9 desaturase)